MKGRARLAILLTCGLVLGAGAQMPQVQIAQPVIVRGKLQGNLFLTTGQSAPAPQPEIEPKGDVVEFVDGSMLHGQLEEMDMAHGLEWESPDVKNPIHFQPGHINLIRFARADAVSLAPTCHLRFANGDDLFGTISSL